MKTNRFIVSLLFIIAMLSWELTATAADAAPATDTSGGLGLAWLIPLLAPIVVTGLKKIPGLFESKVSKNLLPYVCIGVAVLMVLVLNMAGKSSLSIWIAGPVAGALGIGARELLDKGMGLLGLGSAGVKAPEPEVATDQTQQKV